MAESSERALTPDEAACIAAARDHAFARYRRSAPRPAIVPLEDP